MSSGILPFFDEPGNKGRERVPLVAIAVTIYKCRACGSNLLTTGGRDHGQGVKYAEVSDKGEVRCSKCGAVNSLQPVNWSGVKR